MRAIVLESDGRQEPHRRETCPKAAGTLGLATDVEAASCGPTLSQIQGEFRLSFQVAVRIRRRRSLDRLGRGKTRSVFSYRGDPRSRCMKTAEELNEQRGG